MGREHNGIDWGEKNSEPTNLMREVEIKPEIELNTGRIDFGEYTKKLYERNRLSTLQQVPDNWLFKERIERNAKRKISELEKELSVLQREAGLGNLVLQHDGSNNFEYWHFSVGYVQEGSGKKELVESIYKNGHRKISIEKLEPEQVICVLSLGDVLNADDIIALKTSWYRRHPIQPLFIEAGDMVFDMLSGITKDGFYMSSMINTFFRYDNMNKGFTVRELLPVLKGERPANYRINPYSSTSTQP